MVDLDSLMSLPGAIAAFQFSDRGELLSSRMSDGGDLNDTVLDLLSHVCVANISIATMQARGWESMTGAEGFYPISGFTMVGLDWSAVTYRNQGVVLANDQADLQAAYDALGQ